MEKVFLFPGQGSQTVGMAKDLFKEFQEVKAVFQEASDTLGFSMEKLCFEDPESKLTLTEFTQPAILTVSTAIFKALSERCDVRCSVVAGHSLGEYSALVSLGAINFADALKAVHFRGQAMQRAVPVGVGAMAAYLGSNGQEVEQLCKELSTLQELVQVVNYNSPGQLVLSGHKQAVEHVCEKIAEKKLGKAKALPVSAPFHSSLMQPAANEMQQFFQNVTMNSFSGHLVANVDAQFHDTKSYTKEMLIKQIASPVLWTQSLNQIQQKYPEATWVEIGPGKVLQGLAKKTIETANCHVTAELNSVLSVISILAK